jgi:hypothetical protein
MGQGNRRAALAVVALVAGCTAAQPRRYRVHLAFETRSPVRVELRVEDADEARGCGDTATDSANCGACGNVCGLGQQCVASRCVGTASTFRVARLETAGCTLSGDEQNAAGDDRGGLAVGATRVFYNGDTATVSLDASDLSGITPLNRRVDALLSDLRDGTVYTLLDPSGNEPSWNYGGALTATTQLGVLDPATGALTPRRVALSTRIDLREDAGIYAGYGRVVIYSGGPSGEWFDVELPSGAVRPLGAHPAAPGHQRCETWAHWGVAEFFDGEVHVLYAGTGYGAGGTQGIARYRVRDGVTTVVAPFQGGDVCTLSVSVARRRWYFHFEGAPAFVQVSGYGEYVGFCGAAFDVGG